MLWVRWLQHGLRQAICYRRANENQRARPTHAQPASKARVHGGIERDQHVDGHRIVGVRITGHRLELSRREIREVCGAARQLVIQGIRRYHARGPGGYRVPRAAAGKAQAIVDPDARTVRTTLHIPRRFAQCAIRRIEPGLRGTSKQHGLDPISWTPDSPSFGDGGGAWDQVRRAYGASARASRPSSKPRRCGWWRSVARLGRCRRKSVGSLMCAQISSACGPACSRRRAAWRLVAGAADSLAPAFRPS